MDRGLHPHLRGRQGTALLPQRQDGQQQHMALQQSFLPHPEHSMGRRLGRLQGGERNSPPRDNGDRLRKNMAKEERVRTNPYSFLFLL